MIKEVLFPASAKYLLEYLELRSRAEEVVESIHGNNRTGGSCGGVWTQELHGQQGTVVWELGAWTRRHRGHPL